MNKTLSGLCFAAAFGLAATLGAQSTTTSQSATTAKGDHDVTVTGCLAKGAGGGYILSNARVDPAGASTTTAAGSTSTTTASGSTTAGSATTTGTTGANANSPAMTWMLSGNSDLEKHLGHKIQVTGKSAWNGAMDHGRTSTTTASGTGTTASTGTTAAAGTTTPGSAADQPSLDVKSIKMLASSCS
jgi:hypothetical protein